MINIVTGDDDIEEKIRAVNVQSFALCTKKFQMEERSISMQT